MLLILDHCFGFPINSTSTDRYDLILELTLKSFMDFLDIKSLRIISENFLGFKSREAISCFTFLMAFDVVHSFVFDGGLFSNSRENVVKQLFC